MSMVVLKRARPADVLRLAMRRVWSTSPSLGLRADLGSLPAPRPAKQPVAMTPVDERSFDGFARELSSASNEDAVELLARIRMCGGAVTGLYVASNAAGEPMYAQWLVRPREQEALHAVTGGLFPQLSANQVLLEGAYTFAGSRGLGAMADGMRQLLQIAADEGYAAAITYVAAENVPSLKGCARVGFALDHVRLVRRRFGARSVVRTSPDEPSATAFRAALG